MIKPDSVNNILKLLETSNQFLVKSTQLQKEANIAVIDLIKDFDTTVTKKMDLFTNSDNSSTLNVRELSLLIKVSEATIYNWIKANKIVFHQVGNSKTFFKRYEINEIINRYLK